jgi:hypothetical protein
MFTFKKNIIHNLFLLSFVLFLFACKKTKINYHPKRSVIDSQSIKLNDLQFKLIIEGVECKFCAKKVINILEHINNVSKAEFICPNNSFDNCFAKVYLNNDKENINIDEIDRQLKAEDFLLRKIEGEFLAQITKNDSEQLINFLNSTKLVKLKNLKNNNVKSGQFCKVRGILNLAHLDNISYFSAQ